MLSVVNGQKYNAKSIMNTPMIDHAESIDFMIVGADEENAEKAIRKLYELDKKDGRKMKRIKAACITQTILFINKDAWGSDYSKRKVQEEIKRYKYRMDRENTRYKVISEEVQEDGSVIMEIVKEYGNRTAVGNYLD